MSIGIIKRTWTLRICLLIVLIGPLRAWPTRDPDAITFIDEDQDYPEDIVREDKKIREPTDSQNQFSDGKNTNSDKEITDDGFKTDIRFIIGAPYRWACPQCERRDYANRCRKIANCKENL